MTVLHINILGGVQIEQVFPKLYYQPLIFLSNLTLILKKMGSTK